MNVTVNGETVSVSAGCSLHELLGELGFAGKRVAVELNQEIVPRSQLASAVLGEADCLEIVHAIGGG